QAGTRDSLCLSAHLLAEPSDLVVAGRIQERSHTWAADVLSELEHGKSPFELRGGEQRPTTDLAMYGRAQRAHRTGLSSGSRRELSGEGVGDPVDDIGRPADHEEVAPFRSGPQRQPVRLREPSRWIIDAYRPLWSWEADIGLVNVDPAPLSIRLREDRCRETAEIHIPARSQGQTGPRDFRSRAARQGIRSACTLIRGHRGLDRRREVGSGEELTDPNHA